MRWSTRRPPAEYLGGYGLGARSTVRPAEAGRGPTGPRSTLGFVTGASDRHRRGRRLALRGRGQIAAHRRLGRRQLGGEFGPHLKFAGYDAVFFTGVLRKPGLPLHQQRRRRAEGRRLIWGRTPSRPRKLLRAEHGKDLQVACIGPAGEKLALIASVMNNKGRAAARSGLGAVMGSKKLKAVAVQGDLKPQTAQPAEVLREMRKRHVRALPGAVPQLHECGTPGIYDHVLQHRRRSGPELARGRRDRSPPTSRTVARRLVVEKQKRRYGCWRCPIACGGVMKAGTGEYEYPEGRSQARVRDHGHVRQQSLQRQP